MSRSICWVHIGDLHMDEADDWLSLPLLEAIVAETNAHTADAADFVFLPGDNANYGTETQYTTIAAALGKLRFLWRMIPGDHDFEQGTLDIYEAMIPEAEVIAGHRCIVLDIVSAGAGGPDFRLTMHNRNRIAEELAKAAAMDETPLVFMHAYPGDLAADGDAIASAFAEGGVAFVETGHTHYSELLNDGCVVYGATRPAGQIEEDGGQAGFSVACVHDGGPSWRFRRLDAPRPHVQIVAPCDRRLVTKPTDPHHLPRPGTITISARLFGVTRAEIPLVHVDGAKEGEMSLIRDLWAASIPIDQPGLHRIEVICGDASDAIDLLVRDADATPKRRLPVALGQDCHAVGAWPIAGIEGSQLGPNKNGCGW